MDTELADSQYRIISLTGGHRPTSINYTKPGSQLVRLGEPVDVWTIRKEGRTFKLSIGGYRYTRIMNDKVTVTIHPEENVEWIATRREHHNAYTIQPANNESHGWTVPRDPSINPVIEIKPIKSTKSLPPQFLPSQLFRFERVDEE